MEGLIPWEELEARLRPFYPKAGRGRRPCELSAMLRIHCVQLFYNLSDPGMEDLLQEVESVKRLVGLRLTEALPDETTILNFRPLLEKHELRVKWRVAMKPGQHRRLERGSAEALWEKHKASIRAKVEHPFL